MLTISGLTKSFGSVHALKGVDLEIRPGEVVGLVGENGAGKSTLMRILAGTQRPSTGTITRNGKPFAVNSPQQANDQGVAMVFQEQSLLLNLSIAQNIFLGQEQRFIRFGLVNRFWSNQKSTFCLTVFGRSNLVQALCSFRTALMKYWKSATAST